MELYTYILISLIMVSLSESYVISRVDNEVSSVDVVSLDCCFEQLRVVDSTSLSKFKNNVLN